MTFDTEIFFLSVFNEPIQVLKFKHILLTAFLLFPARVDLKTFEDEMYFFIYLILEANLCVDIARAPSSPHGFLLHVS